MDAAVLAKISDVSGLGNVNLIQKRSRQRRMNRLSGLLFREPRVAGLSATTTHELEPRTISFKGVIQSLEAFQPMIALKGEGDASL